MTEIKEILDKINAFLLDKKAEEDELSCWLEFFICDNYNNIQKINQAIARFLNDEVVDICEQTEPGLEGTNFRKEIKEAYDKLLVMLEKQVA